MSLWPLNESSRPPSFSEFEEPIVEVSGLRQEFGEVTALRDLNFSIGEGEVVGILGPNGAGKTTLVKILLGIISPTAGRIRVLGYNPDKEENNLYSHCAAVLEGARNIYWRLTPIENLRYFAGINRIDPRGQAQEFEGILGRLNLKNQLDTPVKDFSRGMKQKVAIACAMVQEPEILFLDEPTIGLDVQSSRDLVSELRRMADDGNTMIITSHDMDVIESLCDRVIILSEGTMVANDSLETLLSENNEEMVNLTIEAPSPEELGDSVKSKWLIEDWSVDGQRVTFSVYLESHEQIYRLLMELESENCRLKNVEIIETDLEEAFLQMVSGRDR